MWRYRPVERLMLRALARPSSPLYVGAVTNWRNIGDALLFDAHEHLLQENLAYLPMGGGNRLAGLRAASGTETRVLLGGGTLIGRPAYRRALDGARVVGRGRVRSSMLSVGVSAIGGHGKSDAEEFERWIETCSRFPVVRVRGPRSAAQLEHFGIHSEIVGDPVLGLLTDVDCTETLHLRGTGHRLMVGLNAAQVPHLDQVAPLLIVACQSLAKSLGQELHVRILVAAPYDGMAAHRTKELLRSCGVQHDLVDLSGRAGSAVAVALASLDVVIAVRLHVAVCCAARDVPFVSLTYEDKCVDFLESIEARSLGARPSDADEQWLAEALSEAMSLETLGRIRERVRALCQLQRRAGVAVRRELGLDSAD